MYDQEWFEVYHAIMQEGLGIGDNNQNPSTAIPALAPLRDAFVGFERDDKQPIAYRLAKDIWYD